MNPKPFSTNYLSELDGHKVYYQEYGNPKGEAIVVLHGGPGDKSKIKHINKFDLDKYRVILFDQRGCGKSEPAGEILSNTLQDIIIDIERIRNVLQISKWYVVGGSWGSTVALAYTETYPKYIKGLLLTSIFLGRQVDVDWSFAKSGGIDKIFPDLWQARSGFLKKYLTSPEKAATTLLKKINKGSQEITEEIVAGVMNWEGNLMTSQSDINFVEPIDITEENIASVKIFLHYEANHFFLAPNQLIKNISVIEDIPTILVHGRYDLLCPIDQMWELQKKLNNVEIVILPTSNHRLTADGELARKYAFRYFLENNSK